MWFKTGQGGSTMLTKQNRFNGSVWDFETNKSGEDSCKQSDTLQFKLLGIAEFLEIRLNLFVCNFGQFWWVPFGLIVFVDEQCSDAFFEI
uniref:Uncharacterized protein n=1 Tax=Megaselia scalaris TaxID=36166 RepID=T1GNE5_MEGSC